MSSVVSLKEAINMIWETIMISREQESSIFPYFFIVGAGISTPEIPSANGIIEHCKDKLNKMYSGQNELEDIVENGKKYDENTAKYYSYWFGTAYKNKIHRQQYLKDIISNSKISTSNLLLAQILNSKKVATTVITPNFDNHLLKSLNLMGNYEVFSTNNMADNLAINPSTSDIQIMHIHGTYQFYDCKNLDTEIVEVAKGQGIKSTARTIEEFLKNQVPIVIGYSGWEDDVLMTKLQERLKCADLPYNLIWFCYSAKDYDNLPSWLKESEDVVFVSANIERSEIDERKEDKEVNEIFLPAEDVLSALIGKFSIEAPYIFSNPIKYYIEVVDSFLPENIDVFPVESWKRRLDYIEGQYTDFDKKMIALDDAAARKDIKKVTEILSNINISYISNEDVTHIINGIVKPIISNKNLIEEKDVIVDFIKRVIELVDEKKSLFSNETISDYIILILTCASKHGRVIGDEEELLIIDNLIDLCNKLGVIEPKLFSKLVKTDFLEDGEKIISLREIISEGRDNVCSISVANVILSVIDELVELEEPIEEELILLLESIKDKFISEKVIIAHYYSVQLHMFEKDVYNSNLSIEEIISDLESFDLSRKLLLHAHIVECKHEKDENKRISISEKAIDEYDLDNIDTCMECIDYCEAIYEIISNKILLSQNIETKYIERAFLLCQKEHHCKYILEKMLYTISRYLDTIDSDYEKKARLNEVITLSYENELFERYCFSIERLFEVLDEDEKKSYILENPISEKAYHANQNNNKAIEEYQNHNVNSCADLLIEASNIFDDIFEQKYNPSLVNICYMVRRGELKNPNINVLDTLNMITWMDGNAFLHINKALIYLQNNDWKMALEAVSEIDTDIYSALQWWQNVDVVGENEMNQVQLLLLISKKININQIYDKDKFDDFCKELKDVPEKYFEKIMIVNQELLSSSNGVTA